MAGIEGYQRAGGAPDHVFDGEKEIPLHATKPQFFIVGQPKTGSTALYEMLTQHPLVFMPELKEPMWFCDDLRPVASSRKADRLPATEDEYLRLFTAATDEQIAGEASVMYLRSHVAARRIAEFAPQARIIITLREPSQLLRSYHLEAYPHVETEPDLRTALALEDARRHGRCLPSCRYPEPELVFYSEHVRYVDQIKRFHAHFSTDQVLILTYEDFRRDEAGFVDNVFRFIGVDPVSVTHANANPSFMVRSRRLAEVTHALTVGDGPVARLAKGAVKSLVGSRLRSKMLDGVYSGLKAPPPTVDEAVMQEIRRRWAPEVAKLSDYLRRDLQTLWGYA